MGNLRSVGGRGEVDLDQRAITTEDDIVDLSELDRSDDQPNQPAPATQNGAAEHDEPSEGQPPAAASRPHRTPAETPPASDAPGRESDEDFDRWVADRAPGLGSAVAASKPSTPPLASDAREPASGDAPTAASGTAGVPCDEATVPPVTSSRSRLRRSGPLSRPLGRLARPAAAIAALTLSAGGTAIAINAATTWHAACAASDRNLERSALTAARATGRAARSARRSQPSTSELHALARAVPPARTHVASAPQAPASPPEPHGRYRQTTVIPPPSASKAPRPPKRRPHRKRTTPRRHPSRPAAPAKQHAGSQTQATSRSQPAFGQNGTPRPRQGRPRHPVRRHPSSASRPSPSSATTPSPCSRCSSRSAARSYAAFSLPAGSVGTRQLRNGAVTSRKLAKQAVTAANLDPESIAGHIADWAQIRADGHVVVVEPARKRRSSTRSDRRVCSACAWHQVDPARTASRSPTRRTSPGRAGQRCRHVRTGRPRSQCQPARSRRSMRLATTCR